MNDAVLAALRCPNCAQPLAAGPGHLRCLRGHSFDLAKQGYATLIAGRTPHSGDTAEMVADRTDFLSAGPYAFIADAVAAHAAQLGSPPPNGSEPTPGLIVDAGAGTGYYLARALDATPDAVGIGLDVSKPALRRCARAHPRAYAALADVWGRLPLGDGTAALVLNVFAPRNGPEFHRVLRPGGALVVVTPAAAHLRELVDAYGLLAVDPDKPERIREALAGCFVAEQTSTLRRTLSLTGTQTRTLIGMTPSARHVSPVVDAGATVTAAVDVTLWRRR